MLYCELDYEIILIIIIIIIYYFNIFFINTSFTFLMVKSNSFGHINKKKYVPYICTVIYIYI